METIKNQLLWSKFTFFLGEITIFSNVISKFPNIDDCVGFLQLTFFKQRIADRQSDHTHFKIIQ